MRPFCIATIGVILGIIMGLYFQSIALLVFFISIISMICIWVIPFEKKKEILKIFCIFLICLFFFWNYIAIKEKQFAQINQKYHQKEIEIHSVVISDREQKEYKDVYQIQVVSVKLEEHEYQQNFKMILNLKREKDKDIVLKYGDQIYFKATYEQPSIARNEGGFDYSQYLKTKNIVGITTIKAEEIQIIGENQVSTIAKTIHDIRESIVERVKEILPEDTANLCTGLLVGEKTELSEEIQESFRNSNLSHLLAISGAHVSYILLGINSMIQKLRVHKRWGKWIIIAFLTFFMALVGFTPSVARSCIMVILQLLASILFRKSDTYQNLAISCFIILLINPYALLDIGFQLSFGGTIGIVLFSKKLFKKQKNLNKVQYMLVIERGWGKIKKMCIVTLSANLVIIPIMLYHFNTLSFTFLISNLLASHILGISLILGMMFLISLFILPLARFLSLFLHPILKLLIWVAEISGKIPFSKILVPTPKTWQIILYYLLLSLILFCKQKPRNRRNYMKRYKKPVILILLILNISPYLFKFVPDNELTISFIDVGQGDSMLIQTPSHKTILIDGGGSETGNFDVGEKTLIPYLLDKGIMKIDYMIFSHFDSDHCQGLLRVMEKLKVKNAIVSKQGENSKNYMQFLKIAKKRKVKIAKVQAGDNIVVDKQCYLSVLFPKQELINANVLNNNSIVAKFVYQINPSKNFTLLLTGDVEAIAEKKLIEEYENTNNLQTDVLKVAHHRFKDLINRTIPRISKT